MRCDDADITSALTFVANLFVLHSLSTESIAGVYPLRIESEWEFNHFMWIHVLDENSSFYTLSSFISLFLLKKCHSIFSLFILKFAFWWWDDDDGDIVSQMNENFFINFIFLHILFPFIPLHSHTDTHPKLFWHQKTHIKFSFFAHKYSQLKNIFIFIWLFLSTFSKLFLSAH